MRVTPKHPDSVKWYWFQWPAEELQGASIATSSWTVSDGVQINDDALNGTIVGVLIAGGERGRFYNVENEIVNSNGETLHFRFQLEIHPSGH
ncbi:MAG: hypothetical protein RPU39_00235 [Candidatus Sedimenticola sp. (ex Thyasira tokunagai)]